jgi:uncharacterized protein (TIGR03437 family)
MCTAVLNTPNVLQIARLAVSSENASLALPDSFNTRPGQAHVAFEVFTDPLAKQQSSTISVQFGQTTASGSVTVTPATAPVITLPEREFTAFGKPVAFTFSAVDPGGLHLTLAADNLPAGAEFNSVTGAFTWTPQAPSGLIYQLGQASPIEKREVTFTATDPNGVSSSGSVLIEADDGLPAITDLRNAGSQISQAIAPKVKSRTQPIPMSCSPGSVASLIGRWLASGTQPASDPTGGSTQLAGTQVSINGNLVPVLYASPNRVDFVCPAAVPGGELEISAQINGTAANVIRANQQATLGLFSGDSSGQGQGEVTLSGTSLLATPRSYLNDGQPAEPGDTISILATGDGLSANPPQVTVSIGGTSTTAAQIEAVPGMAGVFQIDVVVPSSVVPGNAIAVAVQLTDSNGNAVSSNTVTIAVEAAHY